MDGKVGEWVGGWMDGWMDEWMDGWIERASVRWTCRKL